MNKADLINAIAEEAQLKKVDAKAALEATLKVISRNVTQGEKITLLGFGTFKVVKKTSRIGVSPINHQKIEIPAKKVVKFKPSDELNELIK